MRVRLDLADERHLPLVTGLRDEAADWLRRTKDTDQWSRPWPTPEQSRARLLEGLRSGRTWIGWDAGAPVATITTEETGNPKLWTEWDMAEPAVYVHGLVVSRSRAGFGLGAALLAWAGHRAARRYGAQWIRIDVWTTNTALHEYYMGQGFRFVRLCRNPLYPSGALFQRATGAIPRHAARMLAYTAASAP